MDSYSRIATMVQYTHVIWTGGTERGWKHHIKSLQELLALCASEWAFYFVALQFGSFKGFSSGLFDNVSAVAMTLLDMLNGDLG